MSRSIVFLSIKEYIWSFRSQNSDVDDDSDGIHDEKDSMDESDQDELNDELEDKEEETPATLDDDSDGSCYHDSDDDDICEAPEDDTDNVPSDEETEENETRSDDSFDIKDISRILYNCTKLVNIINKSSILHEFTENLARSTVSTDLIVDLRIRWNSNYL